MKDELLKLIQEKSPGAKPLYLVIRGSHAYGTNIESSDTDYAGVFIQPMNDILGVNYKEQINDDTQDTVIYEVRRFLGLLASNNPTVLELLNTPEDCIIYKDPIFDQILEKRDEFITKGCASSFGGYARQQIGKAKGQNKKQNWEKDKVTRKTPLDFCYLLSGEKSIPLTQVLEDKKMDQKFCGLSNVPHSRDTYALFYDFKLSKLPFPEIVSDKNQGFRGIAFEESNELRLSSIPINCPSDYFIGHISYNKDGYSQHCKDYNSYQTWLEERNEARWVDVKSHGQKIDGKNMMHCVRLMGMAREIGEGKGIITRRDNAKELISIRRGEVDLQTLIDDVESEIKQIDEIYKESNLPTKVDGEMVNDLIIKIRKEVYKIK
jgi:hypothetical protein